MALLGMIDAIILHDQWQPSAGTTVDGTFRIIVKIIRHLRQPRIGTST